MTNTRLMGSGEERPKSFRTIKKFGNARTRLFSWNLEVLNENYGIFVFSNVFFVQNTQSGK